MTDSAIKFDNLIHHDGELMFGSFSLDRPAPVKVSAAKKTTSGAHRAKSGRVAAQPTATNTYRWERIVEPESAPPYYAAPVELPLAPPPPPLPYESEWPDEYAAAPGGIAHSGHTGAFALPRRRSWPLALLGGLLAIAALATTLGLNQHGSAGNAMFSGMAGASFVGLAGQLAPALLDNPQAPSASNVAARPAAPGDYNIMGPPSISVATIEAVLLQYNSPAVGNGQAFYDLGVKYGVDPAYMLAFYVHESAAGTAGAAVATKSVGNIICAGWSRCIGRFRAYDSYVQAAEDWYQLITGSLYVGAGLTTPEQITPRYAPASDNNDPNGYAKTVERLVDGWRGKV